VFLLSESLKFIICIYIYMYVCVYFYVVSDLRKESNLIQKDKAFYMNFTNYFFKILKFYFIKLVDKFIQFLCF
jgi:hypothetical protein